MLKIYRFISLLEEDIDCRVRWNHILYMLIDMEKSDLFKSSSLRSIYSELLYQYLEPRIYSKRKLRSRIQKKGTQFVTTEEDRHHSHSRRRHHFHRFQSHYLTLPYIPVWSTVAFNLCLYKHFNKYIK